MVHISGAVPLDADMEAFHGVDNPAFVHEMFKQITKWTARVEHIEDIPEVMAKAFHIARSGRPGPVHVELPRVSDYSEYILQTKPAVLPAYRSIPTVITEPAGADVERIASRLRGARAPVIAAGKGIIRKGALAELATLAERLQAPVIFAQDAIGVIPESHPLFAGHFAHHRSHLLCAEAIERTDLIVAVGLRPGTAEMSELRQRAPEREMIVAGFDDARSSHYEGDDQLVADPMCFLTALITRLGDYRRPIDEARAAHMADVKATMRASLGAQATPHAGSKPIYPGVLMEAMNKVLDDQAIVASDVGNCQMWARTYRRIATPESFMQSGVWNAMSYALPTAIVAKMEFPKRDVVALAGDGAFLMTIGDLSTAAEYGANILMVILNDGAFGQTFMQQTNIYGHTYGTTFKSPNFAAIANASGAKGIRVSEPGEVEAALREGLAATRSQPALTIVFAWNSSLTPWAAPKCWRQSGVSTTQPSKDFKRLLSRI